MTRLPLAFVLAMALSGAAVAQTQTTTGTATTKGTQSTGIAKPPPGTTAPAPKKRNKDNYSNIGANVPTLPTVAQHPTGTIGSEVPIAGPGGTTQAPTGMTP
ncbi:hypothetical protein [Acidocella sp. KAb 2-4]|uniref:hypothetical protein n=1 Tax=Acidocella sp. KAb 2-4 TaxID=2885158 RepID=UPI001D0908B6|nr:hypothetical protein [Acidocella sp. KAb 2-4]MCB5945375.1 hypothetical protein [Acidocella sp. KAb 2-4]